MEIIYSKYKFKKYKMKEIPIGDCFVFADDISRPYIKTNNGFCISLSSGSHLISECWSDAFVYKVNAKVMYDLKDINRE